MDKVVNAIMRTAIQETKSPSEAHLAVIRAGEIAKAYTIADEATLTAVFSLGSEFALGDANNKDSAIRGGDGR